MTSSNFNPRAGDAKEKLRAIVLENGDWRSLGQHPQRSEVFKLFEQLVKESGGKEQEALLETLCLLFDKYPKTEEVYVQTMAQVLCWERLLRMAQTSPLVDDLGLSARKLELIKPHLKKEPLVLPLRKSRHRTEVSEPACPGVRKRLFRVVDNLEGRLIKPGPQSKHPLVSKVKRTNEEWFEQFLGGGRLSRSIYDLLRSSESGFENYRRMLAERPDCQSEIPTDKELLFSLSEDQFAQLWRLLSGRAKNSLAPVLVKALPEPLSLETSLLLSEADSASEGVARLRRFYGTLMRPETWKRLLSEYPGAQPSLRRLLGASIPLPKSAFPGWTVGLGNLDYSMRLLLLDKTIIISQKNSLSCIDAFTGKLQWRHRGRDLPLLDHRVGEDIFLGDKSGRAVRVVANKKRQESSAFDPPTSSDVFRDGDIQWRGGSTFFFVARERPWGSTCFCLETMKVTKTGDRNSKEGYPASEQIPVYSISGVDLEHYNSSHRLWFEPWEGNGYGVPAKIGNVGDRFPPFIRDEHIWGCIITKASKLPFMKKEKMTLAYWKRP